MNLKDKIRVIDNFPKDGISFKDITTLIGDGEGLRESVNLIADHLKDRNAVVVNLTRVTPDQGKRIVDFLSGTLYAIGGDLQKLGGGIFLCTPNNVNVEGKITDDVPAKTSGKKSKQEEDDEFDW